MPELETPPEIHEAPTAEDRRDRFLTEVVRLAEAGSLRPAIDLIYYTLDRLLNEGGFDECDDVLRHAPMRALPSVLRRAFLSITRLAKDRLPSREGQYRLALSLLAGEVGEAEARKRLSGIE